MKRFLALTKAIFLVHIRERSQLFWNFAFPVFLLILYAVIFAGNDVAGFMRWMVPGIISINILAFGLIGSSTMMVEMRTKGVLRRLQASPTPKSHLIGAYLLVNLLIGFLQAALVIAVAVAVYGFDLPWTGLLPAILMITLSLIMAVAIGQVVSGVAPSAGAAVALGQILYFGQMFITDTIMPVSEMPAWIQRISPYLPGYAIAHLVRPTLQGSAFAEDWMSNLLVLVVYAGVAALVASLTFRWEAKSA